MSHETRQRSGHSLDGLQFPTKRRGLLTHHRQVAARNVCNTVNGDVLAFHEVGVKELVLVMRLSGGVQRLIG